MRFPLLLTLLLWSLGALSDVETLMVVEQPADSSFLLRSYLNIIDRLAAERDSLNAISRPLVPNAYYYRLLSFPTIYHAPVQQVMSTKDMQSVDPQIQRVSAANAMLSVLYAHAPQLVLQTEADIAGQTAIRSDVNEKLKTSDRLAEKVAVSMLAPETTDVIEVVTRRPNFWRFSGNTSLQFAQNYISENWFQGGESSYAGNTTLTLRANYNDQKRFTWENTIDAQLGFQTSEQDERRAFRPTSNMLRYVTNFGLKAWKNLYYSAQVILQTQIAPNYRVNTMDVQSDFLSPLDVTIAPGMKYSIAWGKKKAFTGTLNVAPLAYKIRYCDRDLLVRNYGIYEGHNSTHSFGPNITLDSQWKVCKQITWNSRIYWISNLKFTQIDWTNTINFSITKLISAQLNLYPRFDDSQYRFRQQSKHDNYIMFKEWLSLGMNYAF